MTRYSGWKLLLNAWQYAVEYSHIILHSRINYVCNSSFFKKRMEKKKKKLQLQYIMIQTFLPIESSGLLLGLTKTIL